MAENPNYEKLKQKLKKLEKEAVEGKQAQKMLEQKITELDSFINNIPDMAWIKDANSRFVAVNRAFGKEEAKKFLEDDLKVMKGKRQKVIEEKIIDSQYNEVWLETVKSPILDHSGKAIGTVGISRDISKRKRAEETLRQTQDELKRIVKERTADLAKTIEQLRLEIEERKQTQKEASYEQSLMQTLLYNIPDYVYFKDKNRRFVHASNSFCELFGCRMKDIIGKKDEDLFPEEIAEETGSDDRHVIETGIPLINKEEGGESVGGGEHWVLTTKLPWRDNKGNIIGLFGISKEITDRKRAEGALRKSSELFEKTFNSQRDAIFILNTDVPPKITDCNLAAGKTFGYTRQEMLGRSTAFLHVSEATMKKFQENLYPTVEDCGYYYLSEFAMNRKDGTVFPTEHSVFPLQNEQGIRIGWVSVVKDITERKKVEEAWRKSEERYTLATNAARVGVWDWNIQTNEFYLDPNVKTILGYSDAEIPNDLEVWSNYIHPDDKQPVMETFQDHIDGKTHEFAYEHRMLHKDGSIRWIMARGTAIRDDQGNPVRVVGTDTDITDRIKAEEALREKDTKLGRQAKNLIEMNTALKVLLEQRDKEKTEMKEILVANLKKIVYPYIEKLENKGLDEDAQTFVNIIKSNINDLISPLASTLSSKYFALTQSEIQIADLINKQGNRIDAKCLSKSGFISQRQSSQETGFVK
jgi:PAS domain S-box-containing protein